MIYAILFGMLLGLTETHAFELKIDFTGEVPPASQEKLLRVRDRVEVIAASDAFRQEAQRYKTYSCFDSNNLPNGVRSIDEVLDYIQASRVQIEISFFYERSSVRASTGTNHISFNTYYFDSDEEKEIANTLLHETLHTLDFGHCGRNNIRWHPKIKRSIPYRFGDITESLY